MSSGLFLCTCLVQFGMGALGTFQNRRNFLIMLLCIEVMLLAVNLILQTGSVVVDDLNGQLMALWVQTAAAAETAQGQALCVLYFRLRSTLDVELMSLMKGSIFLCQNSSEGEQKTENLCVVCSNQTFGTSSSSRGQDIALSQLKREFNSHWRYSSRKISLTFFFYMEKKLLQQNMMFKKKLLKNQKKLQQKKLPSAELARPSPALGFLKATDSLSSQTVQKMQAFQSKRYWFFENAAPIPGLSSLQKRRETFQKTLFAWKTLHQWLEKCPQNRLKKLGNLSDQWLQIQSIESLSHHSLRKSLFADTAKTRKTLKIWQNGKKGMTSIQKEGDIQILEKGNSSFLSMYSGKAPLYIFF